MLDARGWALDPAWRVAGADGTAPTVDGARHARRPLQRPAPLPGADRLLLHRRFPRRPRSGAHGAPRVPARDRLAGARATGGRAAARRDAARPGRLRGRGPRARRRTSGLEAGDRDPPLPRGPDRPDAQRGDVRGHVADRRAAHRRAAAPRRRRSLSRLPVGGEGGVRCTCASWSATCWSGASRRPRWRSSPCCLPGIWIDTGVPRWWLTAAMLPVEFGLLLLRAASPARAGDPAPERRDPRPADPAVQRLHPLPDGGDLAGREHRQPRTTPCWPGGDDRDRRAVTGWLGIDDVYPSSRRSCAASVAATGRGRGPAGARAADPAGRRAVVAQLRARPAPRPHADAAGLLARGTHRLHRWHCGVPSNTPAVQAACSTARARRAGYRWYDRAPRPRAGREPRRGRARRRGRVALANAGLLAGGSCINSLLSGGAAKRLLTVARCARPAELRGPASAPTSESLLAQPLRLHQRRDGESGTSLTGLCWNAQPIRARKRHRPPQHPRRPRAPSATRSCASQFPLWLAQDIVRGRAGDLLELRGLRRGRPPCRARAARGPGDADRLRPQAAPAAPLHPPRRARSTTTWSCSPTTARPRAAAPRCSTARPSARCWPNGGPGRERGRAAARQPRGRLSGQPARGTASGRPGAGPSSVAVAPSPACASGVCARRGRNDGSACRTHRWTPRTARGGAAELAVCVSGRARPRLREGPARAAAPGGDLLAVSRPDRRPRQPRRHRLRGGARRRRRRGDHRPRRRAQPRSPGRCGASDPLAPFGDEDARPASCRRCCPTPTPGTWSSTGPGCRTAAGRGLRGAAGQPRRARRPPDRPLHPAAGVLGHAHGDLRHPEALHRHVAPPSALVARRWRRAKKIPLRGLHLSWGAVFYIPGLAARSFNGRTTDSGSVYGGSNPPRATMDGTATARRCRQNLWPLRLVA